MKLIYAADDDKKIREILKVFLESSGYEVEVFETGDNLFEQFKKKSSDLVLLDIMMPGTDGLIICNLLRQISKVPIILLTAKDTDTDYIAGLSLGSDDYMTKPFKPTVLIAKINALLRRVDMEKNVVNIQVENQSNLVVGDLIYDVKKHEVTCNDKRIELTPTELRFLVFMMGKVDEAVKKETLLDEIWGYGSEIESRVADETNRRLRKKLTKAGSNVYSQTIWGYGFKLVEKE